MTYFNMNNIVKAQQFHRIMYTALRDDCEMKRIVQQSNFLLRLEREAFIDYIKLDDLTSVVKRYYKLRSICRLKVHHWSLYATSDYVPAEMVKVKVFHDTIVSELTEESLYVDPNRTFYTRADAENQTEENSLLKPEKRSTDLGSKI